MIRVIRFPGSRPHIWIDDVSEFVIDGSNGVLRFDGAEHKFRRVQMPYQAKMITYEIPNYSESHEKHNYREYTVQLLQVDQGEDTSQGEWDEEIGGYLVLTPTCKQTLYFRIVNEPETDAEMTDVETCDVLSVGGCSDTDVATDDCKLLPLE